VSDFGSPVDRSGSARRADSPVGAGRDAWLAALATQFSGGRHASSRGGIANAGQSLIGSPVVDSGGSVSSGQEVGARRGWESASSNRGLSRKRDYVRGGRDLVEPACSVWDRGGAEACQCETSTLIGSPGSCGRPGRGSIPRQRLEGQGEPPHWGPWPPGQLGNRIASHLIFEIGFGCSEPSRICIWLLVIYGNFPPSPLGTGENPGGIIINEVTMSRRICCPEFDRSFYTSDPYGFRSGNMQCIYEQISFFEYSFVDVHKEPFLIDVLKWGGSCDGYFLIQANMFYFHSTNRVFMQLRRHLEKNNQLGANRPRVFRWPHYTDTREIWYWEADGIVPRVPDEYLRAADAKEAVTRRCFETWWCATSSTAYGECTPKHTY